MAAPSETSFHRILLHMSEMDRERLGEALRKLMVNGSILGFESGQAALYQWCYLNRDQIEELAQLLELKLFWDHESRMVQAVPQTSAFTIRLKLDASLILLALWYEFDTAVRDRGEQPPVRLTVEQLNDSLRTKFESLPRHLPSPTRLREILSFAQRKNLLRFLSAEHPSKGIIEILPTLKRVIPFQNIDDWNRQAGRYLAAGTDV